MVYNTIILHDRYKLHETKNRTYHYFTYLLDMFIISPVIQQDPPSL